MGMDRNTVIGFILIGVLFVGMFYFNNRSNQAYLAEQKKIEDSIAKTRPKIDIKAARLDSIRADSLRKVNPQQITAFKTPDSVKEELPVLENDVLKITFSNKGGQPKLVELKRYKTFDGKPVVLENGSFNKLSYPINAGNGHTDSTGNILFITGAKTGSVSSVQTISFLLKDTTGKEIITHQYTLRPNDYLIDFNITLNGANNLVSQNTLNLLWQTEAPQLEKDIKYERLQSHVAYVKNGDFDSDAMGKGNDRKLDKQVDWLAVKQQFFISALIAKNKFQSAFIKWEVPEDSLRIIGQATATCSYVLPGGVSSQVPLQLYYGPSDFNELKKYGNQMQNIVPYGSGIFAFVKYINRYFLLPVFDFLRQYIVSMGLVILLLTLLIRLITSPILYKSYVSGAKMKALKPEIDRLKEKHGDDKQAFSMDQMKLWKTAGVSPLGGCLPALLQIPIFMSLYYFFQSNISLRGQSFLWAKDLAAYDSIATLPFSIPFYGDHVSLFTITATITSLLISIYSMSSMQDNSNPVMKYMPYIFPVLLLGVFNNLPAALTWYYTVSNTITLILQIVIQKYIINHEKILAQIEENRKKPVKQSKLQERMQAMQESQKKLQDLKNKNKK